MKFKGMIIIIIIFLLGYYGYGKYQAMIPKAKEYGKVEVEKFVNIVVNHATRDYSNLNEEGIIIVGRNEAGDISNVDFDLAKVNVIANELVDKIETDLNYIKEGSYRPNEQDSYGQIMEKASNNHGIVSYIPVASLLDIPILSYMNIKVPLKYEMISNVKSEVKSDVQNYGINHIVVKVNIEIVIQQNVVSPFFSEPNIFVFEYPLLVKLVNGLVPGYYSINKS